MSKKLGSSLWATAAAIALSFTLNMPVKAAITTGDTFTFSVAGFNSAGTAGYILGSGLATTFGTTQTFPATGYNGQAYTIDSYEIVGPTTTTAYFKLTTPTNFLTSTQVNGTTITALQFDIGTANSGVGVATGADSIAFDTPITSYTATGSIVYGPGNTSFTLTPTVNLTNGGLSFTAAEGVNTGTSAISSVAVHEFNFSITYASSATATTTTITNVAPLQSTYGQNYAVSVVTAASSGGARPTTGAVTCTLHPLQSGAASTIGPIAINAIDGTAQCVVPPTQAAGTYHVTAAYDSGAGSSFADSVSTGSTLLIGLAPLTIAANDATIVEGSALPILTGTYSGWVNGEDPTALTTVASFSTTATSSSTVGTYPITAGGASSDNYAITYLAGALTVTPSFHHVGIVVAGLRPGGSLVLQNSGADPLSITDNGTFMFSASVAHGSAYDVTVLTQPAGQTCTVQQGTGIVGNADVSGTAINCLDNLSITTTSLGSLRAGQAYSLTLVASGGVPPYIWTAADTGRPLPAGLALSTDGVLSGTPSSAGNYTSLITVLDNSAAPVAQALSTDGFTTKAAGGSVSQEFSGSVTRAEVTTLPVPTLDQWALVLLSILVAWFAAMGLYRTYSR